MEKFLQNMRRNKKLFSSLKRSRIRKTNAGFKLKCDEFVLYRMLWLIILYAPFTSSYDLTNAKYSIYLYMATFAFKALNHLGDDDAWMI